MKWLSLAAIFASGALSAATGLESYRANPQLISVNGYVVLFDAQGPVSYATLTPRDLPARAIPMGDVQTESCQRGISLPFTADLKAQSGKVGGGWGNGGYEAIFKKLKKENPELEGIYDVRIDLHEVSILFIYTKLCTSLAARGFKVSK